MKLKIKDIGPSGRDVSWSLPADEVVSMLQAVGVETSSERAEAQLDLVVNLAGDRVVGRGRIRGSFGVACVRCLGPAEVSLDDPALTVTFVPVSEEAADDWEDASSYGYDGEEIDLEPLVREALVLAIPIAPLCREGCPGLCGGCGVDLSQEKCRCDEGAAASPWKAALARMKPDDVS